MMIYTYSPNIACFKTPITLDLTICMLTTLKGLWVKQLPIMRGTSSFSTLVPNTACYRSLITIRFHDLHADYICMVFKHFRDLVDLEESTNKLFITLLGEFPCHYTSYLRVHCLTSWCYHVVGFG